MPGPHDHVDFIKSIKKIEAEVKQTPKTTRKETMATQVIPEPAWPSLEEESVVVEETGLALEEDDFDLDTQLAALAASVKEKVQEAPPQPMTQEEALQRQIVGLLKTRSDAPSEEQISAWKHKYGEHALQVISFDPENVYIYTHLTSSQWEKLQKLNEAIAKQGNSNLEKSMMEAVLRAAILWPKITPQWQENCRAGLPSTLFELVLVNSYFLTPQQAMTLTSRI